MTPHHHARLVAIAEAAGLRIGPIDDLLGGARAPVILHGSLAATLTVGGSATVTTITLAGTDAQIGAAIARLKHERAVA